MKQVFADAVALGNQPSRDSFANVDLLGIYVGARAIHICRNQPYRRVHHTLPLDH